MQDFYNVSRYIPKKYHKYIDCIEMEPDFDNSTNRTKHFYRVFFKNGFRTSGVGIKELKKNIKTNEKEFGYAV